jgi:hypothetical protein
MIGFCGFVTGFIFGMAVNAYMLRGTPRSQWMADKKIRFRLGLLNWGLAALGVVVTQLVFGN